MTASVRGTIFLERARVISQQAHEAKQFVLRVAASRCAAHALPGSFVHITCDNAIPMRRPLSIMRSDARGRLIEMLYKALGPGLHALASRRPGGAPRALAAIGRRSLSRP